MDSEYDDLRRLVITGPQSNSATNTEHVYADKIHNEMRPLSAPYESPRKESAIYVDPDEMLHAKVKQSKCKYDIAIILYIT